MNPDEKTNRNQSQDDPPFDIDCSTETLTNEQKNQQNNNTWTSEVSDNTMLSAASGSLSGEHDAAGMLFDESELLVTSSQKESQGESDDMTNSDQESTLEAEEKTPELKETKTKLERAEKDINKKQNEMDNQLAKMIAQQDQNRQLRKTDYAKTKLKNYKKKSAN